MQTRQISQLENNFGSDKAAKCIEAMKAEAANEETADSRQQNFNLSLNISFNFNYSLGVDEDEDGAGAGAAVGNECSSWFYLFFGH